MCQLVILGAGPAGYLAAERAAKAGLKTALIEKEHVGGVCLNEGCIPSKAFLYSAKTYQTALHGADYGVTCGNLKFDHKKVLERKNKTVNFLVGGIKNKLKKLGVEIFEGEGMIMPKTAQGFTVKCGKTEIVSERLLIATGSMPAVPPIDGLKEGLKSAFVLTNKEILSIAEIPKKLTVIGGGVIGLEMATYFAAAGSKVTVIEMLQKVGGYIDWEIADSLKAECEKSGIIFKVNCKVTKIGKDFTEFENNGKTEKISSDKILLSIGRKPVIAGFGLENIGVYTEKGAVITDEYMRTNIANCYAAGDVNGKSMLAHTAYREAEVAINNITGKKDSINYNAIPAVIYTMPEVAVAGLTAEQAQSAGIDYKCTKLSMKYSGRYCAENNGDGFIKLIIDKKTDAVIGCHMIGSYVSEFIVSAVMMIERKMKIEDIKKFVFPHPTVCEIIREAVFE